MVCVKKKKETARGKSCHGEKWRKNNNITRSDDIIRGITLPFVSLIYPDLVKTPIV
jgi:hypothetical protein